MRQALLASVTLLALTASAKADLILTFGQAVQGQTVTATANAGGTATTISTTDTAVNITQILGGIPGSAFLDLNLASTDAAAPLGNGLFQHYAGTFSLNSLANNTGTNYLSGTFTDVLLGVNASAVLASSSPPDIINFTSDVITVLGAPQGIAFSFANVSPGISLDNQTLASFTSSVAGTFSANTPVPEPSSLLLLGLGALGVTAFARRKHR